MSGLVLTIVAGFIGGYILFKLKVPGGMMIGAVIGVSVLNIVTSQAVMPLEAKIAAQIVAGAFIGSGVEKSDILNIKNLIKPIFILMGSFLVLSITSGVLIYKLGYMDLLTAMLCAVPGGMSDMPIIAAELGADAAMVTVVQFSRLLAGIGLFPTIIAAIGKRYEQSDENTKEVIPRVKRNTISIKNLLITLSVAGICGYIGKLSGFPAGILVFSMVGTILFKMKFDSVCMPGWFRRIAQMLSGAYIGSSVTINDVKALKTVFVPIIIILTGYLLVCIVIGYVLHKYCKMNAKEAMLSATPAGASDMALIAADLGISSSDLIVMQVARLIIAVGVFPSLLVTVCNFLSFI